MTSYRKQRDERIRLRMSAMGKASQRVQQAERMERMAWRYNRILEAPTRTLILGYTVN